MNSQRESGRQKDANSRRVLDDAARRRRARKALEALEQDNFHDDPHANLGKLLFVNADHHPAHLVLQFLVKKSQSLMNPLKGSKVDVAKRRKTLNTSSKGKMLI